MAYFEGVDHFQEAIILLVPQQCIPMSPLYAAEDAHKAHFTCFISSNVSVITQRSGLNRERQGDGLLISFPGPCR